MALQPHFDLNAVGVKQIINDRIDIMLSADAEVKIEVVKTDLKSQNESI